MSKELFNDLVKLGNSNPELRGDIAPVLRCLKTSSKGRTAATSKPDALKLDISGWDGPWKVADRYDFKEFYFESNGEKHVMELHPTRGLVGFAVCVYPDDLPPDEDRPFGFDPHEFAEELAREMPLVDDVSVFEEMDNQLILEF